MKFSFPAAMTAALACVALTSGCDDASKEVAEPNASSATASSNASADATGTAQQAGGAHDAALAKLKAQALPLESKNHDRGEVCSALRELAEAANDCGECLDVFIKVIDAQGTTAVAACSMDRLPKLTDKSKAEALCKSLATSMAASTNGVYQLGAVTRQGDACKTQLDTVVDAAVKKMDGYENAYNDINTAYLLYLERLLPQLNSDQKGKLVAAAQRLVQAAKTKKDRRGNVSVRLAESADKLAAAAAK